MASVFVRGLPGHKPSAPPSSPSLALRSRRKLVVPTTQTLGGLLPFHTSSSRIPSRSQPLRIRCTNSPGNDQDEEVEDLGVRVALSMLRFYKSEISPILPSSCRYVPTCSEYSMEAYKKYGVVRGTILTAWRLCRCNPLGGSGFDPPRWFDEQTPTEE